MITNLHIENIAVIEQADIEFQNGFNVLTGETGAGKSMVIDSINMVMGEKTSKDLIRTGASSAFVSALFCDLTQSAKNTLGKYDLNCDEDGFLLLQREIQVSGKNTCRINGRPVPASVLKELSCYLLNIHGQHDNQLLLQTDRHISFLDNFLKLDNDLTAYNTCYERVKKLYSELEEIKKEEEQKQEKFDLLSYQIQEIETAKLSDGEEEALTQKRLILSNAQKIAANCEGASVYLYKGADQQQSAYELLSQALTLIEQSQRVDPSFKGCADEIQNAIYTVQEANSLLQDRLDSIDFSDQSLNMIEERLDLISKLKRKYGGSIAQILEFYDQACLKLDKIKNTEKNFIELSADLEKESKQLCALSKNLSDKRKSGAEELQKSILSELSFLNMPKVRFLVEITPKTTDDDYIHFASNGNDKVEFLFSVNPGQTPKSIAKIASGGELSRIMLALKNTLSENDDASTLIFDEVDAGISGKAATKVAMKLYEVSKHRQVLCVTHLVAIASFADTHFLISKEQTDQTTNTLVTPLDFEQRKKELARILSGSEITQATLQNMQEMLDYAQNYKQKHEGVNMHGSI